MDIKRPTLLVDKNKCLKNIEKMLAKAKASNATLRPHFKTHHSAEVAKWYKDSGVNQCTVSSVSMAQYFKSNGWEDITIAFPYNPLEIQEIDELANGIHLNILIESTESLTHAKDHLSNSVGYFIKIDVGTHRTGVDPRNLTLLEQIVEGSQKELKYQGFIAHAGHTYGAGSKEDIQWIFDKAEKSLLPLKEKFGGIISYGDTPSCSIIDNLSMYDELRPGNFVFYDWMQHQIGSCTSEEIAVCMACPVVAIHPDRNELVVHGGAVHFSKDFLPMKSGKTFGKAVSLTDNGWETKVIGNVERLSQEHGIIQMSADLLARIKIGDLIGVIPVHSCLTADLQGHYLSTKGERIEKIVKD